MNLVRLARHQHPAPPDQELRKKGVFDSGSRQVGHVENLYVEEDSVAAVRLYEGRGFRRFSVDVSWRHDPS